ncbi:proton-transporting V-type ATPase complex assembly regulator TMEM9 isoform X6 [Lemur catta]|uniref:proton-transporting V-type ATPase complex assembly regulator TMEM9 isoform X6 n=1 Tax=Lemur catta TaxID=9447 RepID=UPI001E26A24A|nr:proton-transporting V-type ATPase complex assembly regulator TMEM9 isoform X6 [Lemur catta]
MANVSPPSSTVSPLLRHVWWESSHHHCPSPPGPGSPELWSLCPRRQARGPSMRGMNTGAPAGEEAVPLELGYGEEVIIVIYLSVVGALLLYMAFLMLVDPLIRKPDAYTEQLHNEEENEDARSVAAAAASLGGPRANTVLERVEGAQQRWKLQVQEQRKTVFDRHKMLS